MTLNVKVGDRFGVTERDGKERINIVLAIKLNYRGKGPHMKVRNVRGSKEFWLPIWFLNSGIVRRFTPY